MFLVKFPPKNRLHRTELVEIVWCWLHFLNWVYIDKLGADGFLWWSRWRIFHVWVIFHFERFKVALVEFFLWKFGFVFKFVKGRSFLQMSDRKKVKSRVIVSFQCVFFLAINWNLSGKTGGEDFDGFSILNFMHFPPFRPKRFW